MLRQEVKDKSRREFGIIPNLQPGTKQRTTQEFYVVKFGWIKPRCDVEAAGVAVVVICFITRAWSKGKNSMHRARTSRGRSRRADLFVCERRRGIVRRMG